MNETSVTVLSTRQLQVLSLAGRIVTGRSEQWLVRSVVTPTFEATADGYGKVAISPTSYAPYGEGHLELEGSDGYQMIALFDEVRPGVCLAKVGEHSNRDAADPALEHTVDATLPGHFHGLRANDLHTLQSAFSLLIAVEDERWSPPSVEHAHRSLR